MRKAKPKKRILFPDPKFGDGLVTRFVNNLMLDGKKSIAYTIFYDAIEIVGEKMKDADKAPLDIWKKALENITPQVDVKSRRVGGATFQVPTEVRPERKVSIAMRNLILYSKNAQVDRWRKKWLLKFKLRTTKKALPSSGKKRCTEWPKPTRLLPISDFNL